MLPWVRIEVDIEKRDALVLLFCTRKIKVQAIRAIFMGKGTI